MSYGFFNGTCDGSGELPFEVSKEYAQRSLEYAKERVAEFIETPCPKSTADRAWKSCPQVQAWKQVQSAQIARKQYIKHQTPRLAAWVPREQKTVKEVENVETEKKTKRTGIRALSGAEKLAKRILVKFGEKVQVVLSDVLNRELEAERVTWYTQNPNTQWPRWQELTDVPYFATNRVSAYVKLAQKTGLQDVIEQVRELVRLGAEYEAAKAAHKAAK